MTTFYDSAYKDPIHVFDYTVAIAVEHRNMVGLNAAGALVPATDATCTVAIGMAKADYAVGETAQVFMGLLAFNNDTTTPVAATDLFTVGFAGDQDNNITVSGAGATNTQTCGRIISIDSQSGQVWINTLDRG